MYNCVHYRYKYAPGLVGKSSLFGTGQDNIYLNAREYIESFMAEPPEGIPSPLQCSGVITPQINEEQARKIAAKWLGSDTKPFISSEKIRFGKAVMLYYPFWKYVREDGGTDVAVYRPACGMLLSGMQDMQRSYTMITPIPEDADIVPATVYSHVYYPDLYGIARGEELIGIPIWLISYKVKKSIYMVEVDGETGDVYEEWHPLKAPVDWKKTAGIVLIPMLVLSGVAVFVSPWLFFLVAAVVIFFLYKSEMLGVIDLKREEGKDGS